MGDLVNRMIKKVKLFAYKNTSLRPPPEYPYMVEPTQLASLINELERLRSVKGNVVEIGVFRGMTTRFICEYLAGQRMADTTYFAIDTFDSFTDQDIDFEVKQRGKKVSEINSFAINDFEVWSRNFSKFPFVKAIQSDCSTVDYARLSPIKLAFLDVDLYLPTKKTLPKIYGALAGEGVILVDDVMDHGMWDGAYQAYMEFCAEMNIEPEVIGNKCGVIRKPDSPR